MNAGTSSINGHFKAPGPANAPATPGSPVTHEPEWEAIEKEEAAWKAQDAAVPPQDLPTIAGDVHANHASGPSQELQTISGDGRAMSPWEPLNVKRAVTPSGAAPVLLDAPIDLPPPHAPALYPAQPRKSLEQDSQSMARTGTATPTSFHTPLEQPRRSADMDQDRRVPSPVSLPPIDVGPRLPTPGSINPNAGKISAGAFRKGTRPQPRSSLESDETSPSNLKSRRLPVPPLPTTLSVNVTAPSPPVQEMAGRSISGVQAVQAQTPPAPSTQMAHTGSFADAEGESSPPPGYAGDESLR